jgi:predicted ArsR family transcriptional regulator
MTSPTRELILRTLKAQGKCTVKDLAVSAGVSPVSVRHHLSGLLAEDLVVAEEVKHGVGRPYHEFSLTEKAIELYPGRYFRLTNRLLDEIKGHISQDLVAELFSGVAGAMGQEYAAQLEGLPLEQRLPRLMELLASEGFDAEYEWKDDKVIIRELGCPYMQVGRLHRRSARWTPLHRHRPGPTGGTGQLPAQRRCPLHFPGQSPRADTGAGGA